MIIKETSSTPYFNLIEDRGVVEFRGRSVSENVDNYYQHVNDVLSEYIKTKPIHNIDFHIEYINTKSLRYLVKILKMLHESSTATILVWYFEEDDQDLNDVVDTLKTMFKFKIEIELI